MLSPWVLNKQRNYLLMDKISWFNKKGKGKAAAPGAAVG